MTRPMDRPYDATPTEQQHNKPKAVGFIRAELSGQHLSRHTAEVARHAVRLGYLHVCTVFPPQDTADPVDYMLGIAAGLDATAIVVYDLSHINDQPRLVCEDFDLESVNPPETWAHAAPRAPIESGGGVMDGAVIVAPSQVCDRADVELAHELMRHHLVCRVDRCVWKEAAYRTLVDAGRLTPPMWSLRERAAARGLCVPAVGQ